LGKFFQHAPTARGKNELGVAAVCCAASSFDQSFLRQFIKQNHHAAGEHTECFRQGALVARRSPSDDAQNPGMAGSNTQSFDPLAKTIGGVRAELSE
jgi:hypothetical protein